MQLPSEKSITKTNNLETYPTVGLKAVIAHTQDLL